MKLLFVCSKNKWRSRTAETMFRNSAIHKVKSAGTDPNARIKLTAALLDWAEIVFVMEDKHKQMIRQKFRNSYDASKMVVLSIADEYQYMDEELIMSIEVAIAPYLEMD